MDNINEIKKLKKLLDDGIITEEDFNNQKRRLLGLDKKEKLEPVVEKKGAKTLDDYEDELISQIAEENDSQTPEDEINKVYEAEKAKERARLDALSEKKKERNAEINKNINKGITKGKIIFKWFLAVFCWLGAAGGIGTAFEQNPISDTVIGICFALLGCMACPKITEITEKKFMVYTKSKKAIVWIVVIIIFVFAAIQK